MREAQHGMLVSLRLCSCGADNVGLTGGTNDAAAGATCTQCAYVLCRYVPMLLAVHVLDTFETCTVAIAFKVPRVTIWIASVRLKLPCVVAFILHLL